MANFVPHSGYFNRIREISQIIAASGQCRDLEIRYWRLDYRLISRGFSGKLMYHEQRKPEKNCCRKSDRERLPWHDCRIGDRFYGLLRALELGAMVREGFDIVGIPTSAGTEEIATAQQIPLATLATHPIIDLTIDGADEVDKDLNLIKGGGAALVREKNHCQRIQRDIDCCR